MMATDQPTLGRNELQDVTTQTVFSDTSVRGYLPKVCVIGHFRLNSGHYDGQTVRTALVASEIGVRIGNDRVEVVDYAYFRKRPLRTAYQIWQAVARNDIVILMPGRGFVKWACGWLYKLADRYQTRVHCFAVGGWLPGLLRTHPSVLRALEKYSTIQVQTDRMLKELSQLGLRNVELLPNFRRFDQARMPPLPASDPLKLVFYSRVRPEKGIEQALDALHHCNRDHGEVPRATLDIWGPVRAEYEPRLMEIIARTPYAVYRGVLPPSNPYDQLSTYDVLVLPSVWEGEGFPGAILDAYIAGLMVVTTRWKDLSEFVEHGVTGLLVEPRDTDGLTDIFEYLIMTPGLVSEMKRHAWKKADSYHVDTIFPSLLRRMEIAREA